MRIKQISVTNLFNMFNHVVPLNLEDKITIISGPNGFGKTALLKLVNALLTPSLVTLRRIPFEEFVVDFDDGNTVSVTKEQIVRKAKGRRKRKDIKLTFTLKNDKKPKTYSPERAVLLEDVRFPLEIIERELRNLERIGAKKWMDGADGDVLDLEDVLEKYGDVLSIPKSILQYKEESAWLKKIQNSIPVRFIETQRLLTIPAFRSPHEHPRQITMMSAVTKYSTDLANTIKAKLAESASLSQSLDRTFPTRLVKNQVTPTLTEEELLSRLKELEETRLRLISAGLLDKGEEPIEVQSKIEDDTTKRVLSVYIKDVEEKLSIFDEVADKLELMKNIINDHFLFKEMFISKEDGFIFLDSLDNRLLPSELSSGEQHELVLLYELLFKVNPGSLILIDEPELSLHVAWQEEVLRDLGEITQLADLDVLIATHSPQIIHDRWDLTVELKKPS